MLSGEFAEDGLVGRNGRVYRYGHRDFPENGLLDKYTYPAAPGGSDRAKGCNYQMIDRPSQSLFFLPLVSGAAPTKYELHLQFMGQVIDVCNRNSIVASSIWDFDFVFETSAALPQGWREL